MPGSWTQNLYHIVFSTKSREPLIDDELGPRLHGYLGGIARDLGCSALAINGTADHVHLAVRYPSALSHADMVRHLKGRSSRWVNDTFSRPFHFAWQEGYGGFTVSHSALPKLLRYIRGQEEHHQTMTFRDEFMTLLHRHGIDVSEEEALR